MEKLTTEQVKAADTILFMASLENHIWEHEVLDESNNEFTELDMKIAAKHLENDDLILITVSSSPDLYLLTIEGADFKKKTSYKDYHEKNLRKEERENSYKDLQIQDLITKLNTINPNQLDFWNAQKERNKQATLIAIIAASFSLVALLKAWGFFD